MRFQSTVAVLVLIPALSLFGGGTKDTTKTAKAHFALGTVCTITLYGQVDESVFDEAFALIDTIESKMSVSESGSDVAAVNRSAGVSPVEVSVETFTVIERSLEYMELSEGKFDITVQPLVDLWAIGTEYARIPEQKEIDTAKDFVGYADLLVDSDNYTVFLERRGMAIDLGGIAKGYAADVVKDFLLEKGLERGLINFGGNIMTFGEKPTGDPWVIGVQNPFDTRGIPVGTLDLGESSVVTSGVYERYFELDGRRYHHILDPDTGYPVDNELMSVTVVGEESIVADVLSTVVFALGIAKSMTILDRLPGVEAVFVTKQREIVITPGLTDIFELENQEFGIKN